MFVQRVLFCSYTVTCLQLVFFHVFVDVLAFIYFFNIGRRFSFFVFYVLMLLEILGLYVLRSNIVRRLQLAYVLCSCIGRCLQLLCFFLILIDVLALFFFVFLYCQQFSVYVLCFDSCRCFYLVSLYVLSLVDVFSFFIFFLISLTCFFFMLLCWHISPFYVILLADVTIKNNTAEDVTQNCMQSRTLTMILVCLDIFWTALRTSDDSRTSTLYNSATKLSIGELVSNPGSSTFDVKFSSLRRIVEVSLTNCEFCSALVQKYFITKKLGKIMAFILV